MSSDLKLTNVVTISVSAAPVGAGEYNTSNLAIFTRDTPGGGFGSDGYKIYLEPTTVGTDFGTGSVTYKMALKVFSQSPNILTGGGYLVIIPYESSELHDVAVARASTLVQFFGILSAEIQVEARLAATAAVVQALNKIYFAPSRTAADFATDGPLDDLRSAGYTKTRGLYYALGGTDLAALEFAAAYASRGLSTNFNGSNTTQTMHLKDLAGILADTTVTQTQLTACLAAGVDTYPSLQGLGKVFCSGLNTFFDRVYNLEWFSGALQVAGFNALAQSSTKQPQTEAGVDVLKGAYRKVCQLAVTNQYAAPGTWTLPGTFGNQPDFIRNIEEVGFYIYSSPVSAQSAAVRATRAAPLIQIALKEAGAIHSSSVIVNINA